MSGPTWDQKRGQYDVEWETRTKMNKFNMVVGGVQVLQNRGALHDCSSMAMVGNPWSWASEAWQEGPKRCFTETASMTAGSSFDDTFLRGLDSSMFVAQLRCQNTTFCDSVDPTTQSLFPSLFSTKSLNEEAISRYELGLCGNVTARNEFAKKYGSSHNVAAALFLMGREKGTQSTAIPTASPTHAPTANPTVRGCPPASTSSPADPSLL